MIKVVSGVWIWVLLLVFPSLIEAQSLFSNSCNGNRRAICSNTQPLNLFSLSEPGNYDINILDEIEDCEGGAFDVNNPHWFTFVPNATDVRIVVRLLFSCIPGSSNLPGFQYAVLSDCDEMNLVACDREQNGSNGGQVPIILTDLTPGKSYYLVIDGYAGSVCQFELVNLSGIGGEQIEDIGDIDFHGFEDQVCQGAQDVTIDILDQSGALLAGINTANVRITRLDGNGMETFLEQINTNTFNYSFDTPGQYEIFVEATNDCSITSAKFTKSFTVVENVDEVLPPFVFCLSDFAQQALIPEAPYQGPPISAQDIADGQKVFESIDAVGCPLRQIVPLSPQGLNEQIVVDTAFCGPSPISFRGSSYLESVQNLPVILPGQGVNGCDSTMNLTLVILESLGEITQNNCNNGSVILSYDEQHGTPLSLLDSIQYVWKDDQGLVLQNDLSLNHIRINQSQIVRLEVIQYLNDLSCISDYELPVVSNAINLELTCTQNSTSTVTFNWNDIPDILQYALVVDGDTITKQTNTFYSFSDLDPGENVTLEVVAQTNDTCGSISAAADCSGQNCPDLDITIEQSDQNVCLTAAASNTFQFTAALSNQNLGGLGFWESTGIIDPITGLFDINGSGLGSFTVTYRLMIDGTCQYQSNSVSIEIAEAPNLDFQLVPNICETQDIVVVIDDFDPNAVYTWTLSAGGTAGRLPDNNYILDWPTVGDKDVTLEIDQSGCGQVSVSKTINIDEEIANLNLRCTPINNSIRFDWDDVQTGEDYRIVSGTDTISWQSENFIIFDNLSFGDDVTIEVIAIDDGLCSNVSSGLVSCNISNCPSLNISLVQDDLEICLNRDESIVNFEYNITEPANGTGRWISNGVIDELTGEFDPVLNGVGVYQVSYQFEFEDTNCGTVSSELITVTIFEFEPPTFAISSTGCSGNAVNLSLTNFNSTLSYSILSDGAIQLSEIDESNYTVTWNTAGNFELEVIAEHPSCGTLSNTAMIEIINGSQQMINLSCVPSQDQITFSWNPIDCAIDYDVYIDGQYRLTQAFTNYTVVNVGMAEIVDFEVRVNGDCVCGNVVQSVSCGLTACPEMTVTFENPGDICASVDSYQLDFNIEDQTLLNNISWNSPAISANGVLNVNTLGVGIHSIQLMVTNGECIYTNEINFQVFDGPQFAIFVNKPSCNGDLALLQLVSDIGTDNIDLFINDEMILDPSSFELGAGTYDIEVVDRNSACSSKDILMVEGAAQSETIELKTTTNSIAPGQSVLVNIESTVLFGQIDSVHWRYNDTLVCNELACFEELLFTPENSAMLCAEIYYAEGCSISDCLDLEVTDDPFIEPTDINFFIPNVFNINSALPENQKFEILLNDRSFEVLDMWIYDRWGNEIFNSSISIDSGENISWDGKDKSGKVQEIGVYLYKIRYDNNGKLEYDFGDVTLLK